MDDITPNEPRGKAAWRADRGDAPLQTLARGLRILKFVAQQPDLVRLRDVAQAFGLERSVALRLLQSLEAEGFLRKHEALKAYSLGDALEKLARRPSLAEQLTERAKPFLQELTDATGQTSHLGILDQGKAVLVKVNMASGPIAVQQSPGELEALYCSAIGKSIYAFLPEPERAKLSEEIDYIRYTPSTLGDRQALEAESIDIRAAGVAFDRAEGRAPLACIAAPVLSENKEVIASVGISTISALLTSPIDQQRDWIAAVTRCAARMAADLR